MVEAEPERPPWSVRRATAEDAAAIAGVLADAFVDYAWTSWIVPEDDRRERLRALFGLTVSEVGLPFGDVWAALETAGPVVGAVVALRPDRQVPAAVWERVTARDAELMGARAAAARDAEQACEPLRPPEPHVTVATVGVLPRSQRLGIASALMQPVVELADRLGVPAYLETSSAENLRLYRRLDFVVSGRVDITDGPTVWAMRRQRGSGSS